MDSTNPVNIVMGISPIYNCIVVDLNHNDDKENEVFLNATLQFEQFIYLNYDDDSDDSLSLRSTSNLSSPRPHAKRLIDFYFLGGEGIVTSNNGQPVLSCSAGFSAINNVPLQKYLITSTRCLPLNPENISIYHATWLPPFPDQEAFDFFGVKLNDDFKLNPMIRNSVNEFPLTIIDDFNNDRGLLSVGHHLCISGYESHISCGQVIASGVKACLLSRRPGTRADNFRNMIRASMPASYKDVGGTVYNNENRNGDIITLYME
ncbi:12283_t:CDS:2 [Gigaspora margarita]|uniref:12283_t:CDS:1 n=1 Tax=Gigaspora margarita TaxID=4874 RepID=A0ABN7WNR9_GIGMA|nr:12283_t:CDS:2 [Gigaspora margarita]